MAINDSSDYNNSNQFLGGLGRLGGVGLPNLGYATIPLSPPLMLQHAENLWFNQKDIVLDGWKFSFCRFDKCRIFLSSQHFELINCKIDDQCDIYYRNNTINIIKLFDSRYSQPFLPPNFSAIRNSDGTISIVR
ncbi:hypothetical protein RSM41_003873 [Klebsiella aerogenes]|nr:hypothetical protein [Klebsiella aerogenes]